MADEKPSLHIDSDWKRQAQEEKQRQAEAEKARQAKASEGVAGRINPDGAALAGSGVAAPAGTPAGRGAAGQTAGKREMPPVSFATLVQSIVTQALYYMGDLSPRGSAPVMQLDMAKFHVDTLGLLDAKTKGNLSPEEQRLLDAALYETRMRYVQIASQFIT